MYLHVSLHDEEGLHNQPVGVKCACDAKTGEQFARQQPHSHTRVVDTGSLTGINLTDQIEALHFLVPHLKARVLGEGCY